jgi:GT2 family glycosyltransferase
MIEVVSATRMSERDFWTRSALGLSLQRLGRNGRLDAFISFENRRGLPEVYNERIDAAPAAHALAFIHDDVWIPDFFFHDRLVDALRHFDVVGIAGNRVRVPRQAAWGFLDDKFTPADQGMLSGSVAHGKHPYGPVAYFGPAPAACELLDGLFMAANAGVLRQQGVRFDPQFDFHFYDMDFCRSARQRGLRVGTWPICMVHQSEGGFDTPLWHRKHASYMEKWEAPA